jgi:hypothetical protein
MITCGCCGAAYDRAAWNDLELLGPVDPELLDPGEHAEQRNCRCGSTQTLEMTASCALCEWMAGGSIAGKGPAPQCPADCTCVCHG